MLCDLVRRRRDWRAAAALLGTGGQRHAVDGGAGRMSIPSFDRGWDHNQRAIPPRTGVIVSFQQIDTVASGPPPPDRLGWRPSR